MPPKNRPGGPTPKVEFVVQWTPNEAAHYALAIAHYQALLSKDTGEQIQPSHPVVELQLMVIERCLPMIATCVANGWDCKYLIVLQDAINAHKQAMIDEENDGK